MKGLRVFGLAVVSSVLLTISGVHSVNATELVKSNKCFEYELKHKRFIGNDVYEYDKIKKRINERFKDFIEDKKHIDWKEILR